MYVLQRCNLAAPLFAGATQLDLIAKAFQEFVHESYASPQFFMAELDHEREKAGRLNDRLLITSQCLADCHSYTLQHVWIDSPKYFAENHGVADCADRFVGLG